MRPRGVPELNQNCSEFVEHVMKIATIAKKHEKPNPNMGVAGGIVDREMPLHVSNVALFNTKTKKSDRIGIQISDNGSKERIFRSTGETVDI